MCPQPVISMPCECWLYQWCVYWKWTLVGSLYPTAYTCTQQRIQIESRIVNIFISRNIRHCNHHGLKKSIDNQSTKNVFPLFYWQEPPFLCNIRLNSNEAFNKRIVIVKHLRSHNSGWSFLTLLNFEIHLYVRSASIMRCRSWMQLQLYF